MLIKTEKELTDHLIWAICVTPEKIPTGVMNKKGSKFKFKKLDAFDVLSRHLQKIDDGYPSVFFSLDKPVDAKKVNSIKRVLFFSQPEELYVLCDVRIFRNNEGTPFIPDEARKELQVEPWCNQPRKTWLQIFNYTQILNIDELAQFKLNNLNNVHNCENLAELLRTSKRFNTVYCVIN